MVIYDISGEVFSCERYEGDPVPRKTSLSSLEAGAAYALTRISMGSHTGTHMDAPCHIFLDGVDISQVPLEHCVGSCKVVETYGELTAGRMQTILGDGTKKLLFKGKVVVSLAAARTMVAYGVQCVGVESLSIDSQSGSLAIHKELLKNGISILEGLVLSDVSPGKYMLAAQPLKLAGVDGSPVRAILIKGI